MDALVAQLGDEVQDVDAETFDIFSQPFSMEDLGMLDPKATVLDITIAGRDFEITQSPGLLQSSRDGGTTGAALWQSTLRCAEWLASPTNFLYTSGILDSGSLVLELGAGISGILPCILASHVKKVVATDQPYTLKALRSNIDMNARSNRTTNKMKDYNIEVCPLDWEKDDVAGFLRAHDFQGGFDAILACDCIYNYALIEPFVQTCADLCRSRSRDEHHTANRPTICVVVQQLRQAEVFEQWMSAFHKLFRSWRIPGDLLPRDLQEDSGFAVHVGILRSR
ncbi:Diaminohydroxyphosphoribosylamino-pyrimidine deaminase [Cercospora beticola]|uniref:Diaminohydroxyphosphoribosylamino-pyrimidine deaminase n=2 Tax=Cercospora beticola TaxID=122368 RepID=A0A2G5HM49_CERBT|nr:Diaminohydroxyphosphoribosylamino-pyrimidine deaminase [Cercospora beticola]PIA93629.1 Diaminohydroxyphosphoribosylamino-pyrimidine deaminase [Cercospora beticola]CAK1363823.1 unnamed protein product [Cercospora beticola]